MKNIIFLFTILCISTLGYSQTTVGDYTVDNLESNTKFSDFGTTFYQDNKIIFSSSRGKGFFTPIFKKNKQPYLNLYEGIINLDGNVSEVKKFSNNLNTKVHEAAVSFTPDQKTVYFTRNSYFETKLGKDDAGITNLAIYRATVAPDGGWTNLTSLPFNNENYSVAHPTVSADGKKLYFSSDMPGTLGNLDIFVVDINEDGTYGTPKNLGAKINTVQKEMFPFIDDDDILYFSSNGKQGAGGLDVYAAKIYPTSVSDVLHLGKPINSSADDFAYILKNGDKKNEGYFSSNRDGGKGDDDIYHFVSSPPLKIEAKQTVLGTVVDNKTQEGIKGAVVVLFDDKDNEIATTTTDDKGAFTFTVKEKTAYKVVASDLRYESETKTFKTKAGTDLKVNLAFNLEPIPDVIEVRERIVVNIDPIYFDFNKFSIRSDAAVELDKVVDIMKKYPELLIEGGSHTDSRGPAQYNAILSNRRATATVKYIVNHGIDESRISAKGYGESQLTNNCDGTIKCSEDEHQQNRRTEFVILNPDSLGFRTIKKQE